MASKRGRKSEKTVAGTNRRQKYSDYERVAALCVLEANGGNIDATAVDTGIPAQTIRNWTTGHRASYLHAFARSQRGDMAAAFREMVWLTLGSAAAKVEAAPFNHLMTGAGIAFDKMRVLEGLPTNNTYSSNTNVNLDLARLSPEERRALADILRKADATVPAAHVGEPRTVVSTSGTGPAVVPGVPARILPDDGAEPPRQAGG